MATEEIQMPAEAGTTFKALAQWLRADLHQRKAHSPEWDARLIYRLPANIRGETTPDAAILVKLMTDSLISLMPHEHGGLPGVWISRRELENPNEVAAHRMRVILMRVSKDARETAARSATPAP